MPNRGIDLPNRLTGCTVLVVEDEFLIALDLQFTLEGEGAEVVVASSVSEALNEATERYSTAILDVRLPDGEVFPVAHRLARYGVPLVFHSGHADGEDILRDFPDAVTLPKPAPDRVMVDAVARTAMN